MMFSSARGLRQALSHPPPPRPASGGTQAEWRAEMLQLELERVLMISEALWSILKEKFALSDEELEQRVMEIDLRDGKLDGQVARSGPAQCPHCQRPVLSRRPICLYCGQPFQPDLFGR